MKTLSEVLEGLRAQAQGTQAHYGRAFEVLAKNLLLSAPVWRSHFRRVWLWGELNQGGDTGIDLVAEDALGKLYGVQAKCYEAGHQISKPDIDTFLTRLGGTVDVEGQRRTFDHGMVLATTDAINANAEAALDDFRVPVQVFRLHDLEAFEGVDWEALALGTPAVSVEKPLRDYQLEALAAAERHFATHGRGKLIMACGTGKTLTSLRILEQIIPGGGWPSFWCLPLPC